MESKIVKLRETEGRMVVARGWGMGEKEDFDQRDRLLVVK
jgi:hypothetical protein